MEWKEKNSSSNEINHKRPIIERPIIRYPHFALNECKICIKNIPLKCIMLQVSSNLKLGTIVSNAYPNDHGKT